MPLRIIKAALRDALLECCGVDNVDNVVNKLVDELGWRPPVTTLVEVDQLDRLPLGTSVLVGNLQDPSKYLHVGVVATNCILFTGEEEPHPFREPGLAPPLPCTVVWEPEESSQ